MYNINNLNELKSKLRIKYPQLSDLDVRYNLGGEIEMLKMVAYKLGKTKQEMYEIVEQL